MSQVYHVFLRYHANSYEDDSAQGKRTGMGLMQDKVEFCIELCAGKFGSAEKIDSILGGSIKE